jgi:hypothetical protein
MTSPLATAFEKFSPEYVSIDDTLKKSLQEIYEAFNNESYSANVKEWVSLNGWEIISQVAFRTSAYFSNVESIVIEFVKKIMHVDKSGSIDDKKNLTSSLVDSYIPRNLVHEGVSTCTRIKNRGFDESANENEREYFKALGEFFLSIIQNYELQNLPSPDGNVAINSLSAFSPELLSIYDVLYKDRNYPASDSFSSINRVLNELTSNASQWYNTAGENKNDDKYDWAKSCLDELNRNRFDKNLYKENKFELHQSQVSKLYGKLPGKMDLDQSYLYGSTQRDIYENTKDFKVRIRAIRARDLAAFDKNGLSDPFVAIKVGNKEVFKTKTEKKNLNPEWEYEKNDKDAVFSTSRGKQNTIQILDWDLIGKNDVMCSFTIDFAALRSMLKFVSTDATDYITLVLCDPEAVEGEKLGMEQQGFLTMNIAFI